MVGGITNVVQFRAVQDMAFHDKQLWMQAWVIRNHPSEYSAPLHVMNGG